MTAGTRVSTANDFVNLAVYERAGPQGKIASIVLTNLEYDESWRPDAALFVVLVWAIIALTGIIGLPQLPFVNDGLYIGWWVVSLAGFILLINWAKLPWKINRTIELDFGQDALKVFRNGKLEQQRQLSRMANLTVEEHPQAEIERFNRQQKGDKNLSRAEKQHCLFGWFGAGGAEKVMLLARAEWPSNNSLFEVRQAMLWAIQRAAGPGAPDLLDESPDLKSPGAKAQGLNPPLD